MIGCPAGTCLRHYDPCAPGSACALTVTKYTITPEDRERWRRYIHYEAQRLVLEAERLGVVVTIESVPLQPLAMGHARMVVASRVKRGLA